MEEKSKRESIIRFLTNKDRWYIRYIRRKKWAKAASDKVQRIARYKRIALVFFGIDIAAVLILKLWSILFNKVISLKSIFEFKYDIGCLLGMTIVLILAVLKSIVIVRFSKLGNKAASKIDSIVRFIAYVLLFLVFIVSLSRNWRSFIFVVGMEILLYLFADWFRQFKLIPHIIADIVTLGVLYCIQYLDNSYITIVSIAVVFIRYFIITSLNIRWDGFKCHFKDLLFYNGKFHLPSELLSFYVFLSIVVVMDEKWNMGSFVSSVLLIGFIYSLMMHIRLIFYTIYGITPKEVSYLIIGSMVLLVYIMVVNFVDPDGLLSFFPLLLTLIHDRLPQLATDKWRNYELSFSKEGKKLFTRLELFLITVVFTNYVLLKKDPKWLAKQFWFQIPRKIMPSLLKNNHSFIPLFSIFIGLIFVGILTLLINLLVIPNNSFIEKRSNNHLKDNDAIDVVEYDKSEWF
ncbi:hypothetical protein [Streptococcus sobrinus]|uniref:hypothetical protein n=1 Tax=Streptococcus sobrinus TaxID=1310 RepID=UPI0002EF3CC1|nr:hypothetical protein [Streptococcus sobrinus]